MGSLILFLIPFPVAAIRYYQTGKDFKILKYTWYGWLPVFFLYYSAQGSMCPTFNDELRLIIATPIIIVASFRCILIFKPVAAKIIYLLLFAGYIFSAISTLEKIPGDYDVFYNNVGETIYTVKEYISSDAIQACS